MLMLLVLAVVGRIALSVLAVPAVRLVAGMLGLGCQVDAIELELIAGEARIYGLVLWPEDGEVESPLLELEYAALDVATSALLRGDLIVRRVEADGLALYTERDEQGRWNFMSVLEPLLATSDDADAEDTTEDEEESDSADGPFEFDLPFTIDAIRGTHLRLHLVDDLATPPLDTIITANLRLTDLGNRERPTRLSVAAAGRDVLDIFELTGEASAAGPKLSASLKVRMRGLHPRPLAGYLALIGLAPDSDRLDAGVQIAMESLATEAGGNLFTLELTDAHWTVDASKDLQLDRWHASVTVDPGPRVTVAPIEVTGASASATLNAEGQLALAGFTFIGTVPRTEPDDTPPEEDEVAEDAREADEQGAQAVVDAPASGLGALLPFPIRSEGLTASNCALRFVDEASDPAVVLEVELTELALGAIDPEQLGGVTTLSAQLVVPGVFGTIDVSGECTPFADAPALSTTLASRGADLERIAPYLEALGLESEWQDGRFDGHLDAHAIRTERGNWSVGVEFSDLRLTDGDADRAWFALDHVALSGFEIDTERRRIQLGEGLLGGLQSGVARGEDGSWRAFGLRTRAGATELVIRAEDLAGAYDEGESPAPIAPEPAPAADADHPHGLTPWRIEIGRLAVEDTDLTFRDAAAGLDVAFEFDDLGFSLEDLSLGGNTGQEARHAKLNIWLKEPELADSLSLRGELTSQPGVLGVDWDLDLEGEGLSPHALAPYLERVNIQLVDATTTLAGKLQGSLAFNDDGLDFDTSLTQFSFGPPEAPFIGASELKLAGLHVSPQAIRVQSLTIVDPLLRIEREADGALLVAGLRIGGKQDVPVDEEATAEVAADDATDDVATTEDMSAEQAVAEQQIIVTSDEAPQNPFAFLDALELSFELDHFGLDGGRLLWNDATGEADFDVVMLFDYTLDNLALRRDAADATFSARLEFEGKDKPIRAEGNVALDPRAIRLTAKLSADHLDFEQMSHYFPVTLTPEAKDAHFEATLRAELVALEDGSRALTLECNELSLREAEAEAPVLSLARARLHAPRVNAELRQLDVAEIVTEDLELHVHRDLEGRIHALGLVFDPDAKAAATVTDSVEEQDEGPEVRKVARVPVAADAGLPSIQLGHLDVGIDRLVLTDERQGEGAEPLVISMRAATPEALVLMGEDPGGLPPYRLRLAATVSPLIEELAVDLEVSPFAGHPNLKGTLSMRGVDGAGLVALAPRLAEAVDAEGLSAGELDGTFEIMLDARRRGLTGFDFRRGFGIDAALTDLAFRAEPDGEVLLGLGSLEVSAPRIQLARKDVHVQRIEFVDPLLHFSRGADGVHALGLVIDPVALQSALSPPAEEGEAAATDTAPAAPEVAPQPVAEAVAEENTAAPAEPLGELRIDELLVSGLDFDFRDETYDPAFHLPITGLSVEVSRFTTRALTEKHAVHFNVYVDSGVVDLGEDHEPRHFFEEATLAGQVALFPVVEGNVDAGVTELALRALRGPAGASGITISEGSMDGALHVRLRGERGLTIDSRASFRELSVSEPSDGPIRSFLGISMPLETALFALRNTDGDVVIAPPTIKVSQSGISKAEITRIATVAITKEITLAVARSPFRLTKGVADTAGDLTGYVPIVGGVTESIFGGVSGWIGGGEEEELPPLGSLDFLPGDANLLPSEQPKLAAAIERMRDDKKLVIVLAHEMTQADLDRASQLANPPADDCRELAIGLRRKRASLMRIRDEVTAGARTQLLTGSESDAAESIKRLRALDAELGRTEIALDRVLELLQPGAERRREKRGRKAAMTVAEARLGAIVAVLQASGIKNIGERIEVRRPRRRVAEAEDLPADQGGRVTVAVR